MNWDWFHLVYYLAVAFIIMKVFSKVFFFLGAIVSLIVPAKARPLFTILLLAVPYYLITSFSVLIETGIKGEDGGFHLTLICFFFLMIEVVSEALGVGSEARRSGDEDLYAIARARSWFLLAVIAFFIYLHFDLSPAINSVTYIIVEIIDWIDSIPILRTILMIVSAIYAISMVVWTLFVLFGTFVSVIVNRR